MRYGTIRVMIDYNNQSDIWWEKGGSALWDEYIHTKDKYGYLNLTLPMAKEFIRKAEKIKGWFSAKIPFAPYPLRFQNVNCEEIDSITIKEITNAAELVQ